MLRLHGFNILAGGSHMKQQPLEIRNTCRRCAIPKQVQASLLLVFAIDETKFRASLGWWLLDAF
jgi:hypothetical protein